MRLVVFSAFLLFGCAAKTTVAPPVPQVPKDPCLHFDNGPCAHVVPVPPEPEEEPEPEPVRLIEV